jgi:hypothetical protein
MICKANAEQVVQLRPFVSIQKSFVTLNDIADLSTSDLPSLIRLMSIPIGKSPKKGEIVLLDRTEIQSWVSRKLGTFSRDINWAGAAQIKIAAAPNNIDNRKLSAIAFDNVEACLNQSEKKYEITQISVPDWFEMPAGDISYVARPISESNIRDRQVRSRVDIMVDQKLFKSVSLDFRVLTSKQNRTTETGSMSSATIRDEKPIETKPQIISEDKNKEAIAAGQWAVMHANTRGLTLESKVKAMKSGKIGDVVPVQLSDGKSTLSAKIVAVNTLEMVD